MKAIVQDRYGTADDLVLADIDKPVAGKGDVLRRSRVLRPQSCADAEGNPRDRRW